MIPKILVAGVGNIFLGDDAFGVEVSRVLAHRKLPEGVRVVDYGIRGFDLAYALIECWDTVILVDALPRGGSAGTLYLLEPDLNAIRDARPDESMMNPHGMDPLRVLQLAFSAGEVNAKVFVVGCEPNDFGDELQGRMGLSAAVQASVEEAATMVESLVGKILAETVMCPA